MPPDSGTCFGVRGDTRRFVWCGRYAKGHPSKSSRPYPVPSMTRAVIFPNPSAQAKAVRCQPSTKYHPSSFFMMRIGLSYKASWSSSPAHSRMALNRFGSDLRKPIMKSSVGSDSPLYFNPLVRTVLGLICISLHGRSNSIPWRMISASGDLSRMSSIRSEWLGGGTGELLGGVDLVGAGTLVVDRVRTIRR